MIPALHDLDLPIAALPRNAIDQNARSVVIMSEQDYEGLMETEVRVRDRRVGKGALAPCPPF